MNFEFPIEEISFSFETFGDANLNFRLNGREIGTTILGKDLEEDNVLEIILNKKDPADKTSYAVIQNFLVNTGQFRDSIAVIPHTVDQTKHPDAPAQIINNLYFGYIGTTVFKFSHRTDALSKAAWLIADKEFEYVKWPLRGDTYRSKNFETIRRDAKYMFTGSLSPATKEIINFVDDLTIGNLKQPLKHKQDKAKLEQWINQSTRVQLQNFESLPYFTYSQGIVEALNSFVMSSDKIYMPKKMYYFHGEILQDKSIVVKDVMQDELEEGSNVLFEMPSPWYSTEKLLQKIKDAKDKNCKVALDLTWLPITNDPIDLDLALVDQIYFSMNKTWPIHDLRPAFRWSRERINDAQTFQYEYNSYPKVAANTLFKLINKFNFDYTFDKYCTDAKSICEQFSLATTSVLWFTTHDTVKHDNAEYISSFYFLDDFVCIRKLLDYKNKYWW